MFSVSSQINLLRAHLSVTTPSSGKEKEEEVSGSREEAEEAQAPIDAMELVNQK